MPITILLAAVFCLAAAPAFASGKIFYGSRVGMQVTVRSVSGIGSSHAIIHVEHTPADAKTFCVEYSNDISQKCVRDTLRKTHLNDVLEGDCTSGRFVSLFGDHLRFIGENKHPQDGEPKYRIVDDKGEALDGSGASGHGYNLEQFEALCPARAFGTD